MQKKFDKNLKQTMELAAEKLPAPLALEAPVLLAVSGGVDSMSMAELFAHSSSGIPFALAHCNFSLRGEESDGDEALVTSWAEQHQVRLFKVRFDTEAYAREHAVSIEMAARELRYRWFARTCREEGCRAVAVAHNANDNAETLFLNLLRGTGVRGLAGMTAVSDLPYAPEIQLLRPLLPFTRKQIEGYAFANGLAWREDRTNAETEYKRNRIRNQVFPLFSKINPSFIRTVNREMAHFADAEAILDEHYLSRKATFLKIDRENAVIDVEALLAERHWKYLLYRALEPYGFNSSVFSSLEELLMSERTLSGKSFLSDSHLLETASGKLLVRPMEQLEEVDRLLEIPGPGVYNFCGHDFEVSAVLPAGEIELRQPEGVILFDAGAVSFPFYLRNWVQGDWFVPSGMKGRKKVSDYFTDRKATLQEKRTAAMLVKEPDTAAGHISAILCSRIDDSIKVTPATTAVVVIRAR